MFVAAFPCLPTLKDFESECWEFEPLRPHQKYQRFTTFYILKDQYVNLRPVRLFEGVPCPLANKKPGDIDFYVVRENVEGEYSAIGWIQYEGTEHEFVIQQSIFTRRGIDRILK